MNSGELLSLVERKAPFGGKVGMGSRLYEDLGFDSALTMDLILSIEDQFGVVFPDDALSLESLGTPQKIWDLIDHLRAKT